jgi:hypothetical protein
MTTKEKNKMSTNEDILKELQEIKILLKELSRKVIKGEEKPSVTDKILSDPIDGEAVKINMDLSGNNKGDNKK